MYGFIDIHSHILPGLDDGAKNMEESLAMLRIAHREGIRTIIATPHFHEKYFKNNTADRISEAVRELTEAAADILPDMKICPGCEVRYSQDTVRLLEEEQLAAMAGTKYLLTEFSAAETARQIQEGLQELMFAGYIPVLAHAERYPSLFEKSGRIRELIELGAYIQVDADSLTGGMGRAIKHNSLKMLVNGEIHFVATDSHDPVRRAPLLAKCAKIIEKKLGKAEMTELLVKNPATLLKNEYL